MKQFVDRTAVVRGNAVDRHFRIGSVDMRDRYGNRPAKIRGDPVEIDLGDAVGEQSMSVSKRALLKRTKPV